MIICIDNKEKSSKIAVYYLVCICGWYLNYPSGIKEDKGWWLLENSKHSMLRTTHGDP